MKNAVISGGGRGLGSAIAAAFDTAGITITLLGRDLARLQETASELNNANCLQLDVTHAEAVKAAFDEIGEIDILVNNAGIGPSSPFNRHSIEDWRNTFAVNVDGAFYCTQAVIDGMLERDSGRVINIASTSALKGYAYVAGYVASKHALLGLTRALAIEYAGTGITFNAICPGFAETDLLTDSVDNIVNKTSRSIEETRKMLASNNPQGRFIQPDEVAATALWLISDAACSITGQAISISGGEI